MSEWWTYRLSDFLMFSPATYWRLVERYNREAWPLHVLMLGAGMLLLWLALARPTNRVTPLVLAATWLWVASAFHWRRYAPINWAAEYLAAAFALQAALLAAAAMTRPASAPVTRDRMRQAGLALATAGVLLYPLAGELAGRSWSQAEVFGLMPEPTALATLGLLLATGHGARSWLTIIPVLSLVVGLATLWLLSG